MLTRGRIQHETERDRRVRERDNKRDQSLQKERSTRKQNRLLPTPPRQQLHSEEIEIKRTQQSDSESESPRQSFLMSNMSNMSKMSNSNKAHKIVRQRRHRGSY